MRPVECLCVALLSGCTVEVGAGSVAPVLVDDPIDVTGLTPPLSLDVELDFLTADQSQSMADQYGSKLGAVDAIDVDVQVLALEDLAGAVIEGASVIVWCDGVMIDRARTRVRLAPQTKQKILTAVTQRAALSLPLRLVIDWPAQRPTDAVDVHALFQPILLVNALRAL